MSNQAAGNSHSNNLQNTMLVVGLVLVFVTVVSFFMEPTPDVVPEPPAEIAAKIEANIQPVAVVEVAAPVTAHVAKSGAEVVKGGCAMCHAAGLMSAPIIGDKAQWQPRIAQGYETLVKHAVEGIRSMPAKGGNADLSDEEVAAAVVEMANASGATFDVPKAPEAAPAAAEAEVAPAS